MSEIKNINLDVANFAMECVEDASNENEVIDAKKYKTLAKKMTTLIQKNGLIATLVFILSKSNNNRKSVKENDKLKIKKKQHNNKILNDIIYWNIKNDKINKLIDLEQSEVNTNKYNTYCVTKYIEEISKLNQLNYRLVTKEMMNLFVWIKRFVDGMIEGEE